MRQELVLDLIASGDANRAAIMQKFFQTQEGQYAAGDVFLGIQVPNVRKVIKPYISLANQEDITFLLQSKYHEVRFAALQILVTHFQQVKDVDEKKRLFDFYLSPEVLVRINNWDLVDSSCIKIVGGYLLETNFKDRNILYQMACDKSIWSRRIAMVSTLHFVRSGIFDDAINLGRILLSDDHDLIKKAVGWILREVGVKNKAILVDFLEHHVVDMSSVTFGYVMEKFSIEERGAYRIRRYNKSIKV